MGERERQRGMEGERERYKDREGREGGEDSPSIVFANDV